MPPCVIFILPLFCGKTAENFTILTLAKTMPNGKGVEAKISRFCTPAHHSKKTLKKPLTYFPHGLIFLQVIGLDRAIDHYAPRLFRKRKGRGNGFLSFCTVRTQAN